MTLAELLQRDAAVAVAVEAMELGVGAGTGERRGGDRADGGGDERAGRELAETASVRATAFDFAVDEAPQGLAGGAAPLEYSPVPIDTRLARSRVQYPALEASVNN